MTEIKVIKCQFCGSTEFGVGYHYDEASILSSKTGIVGSKVIYTICKECGSIVHSRVENAEVFKNLTDE